MAPSSQFQPALGQPQRRTTLDLPIWILDDYLTRAKPTAFRFVIMLWRHGRQVTDQDGHRRMHWRASFAEFARAVGASKPHLIAAEQWLASEGLFRVHQQTKVRGGHAVSAPIDPPIGYKLLPLPEAKTRTHDDDDLETLERQIDRSPERQRLASSSSQKDSRAVTICDRLDAELGVTAPAFWLRQFGADNCEAVLEHVASVIAGQPAAPLRYGEDPAPRSRLSNPAGYARVWLTSHTRERG